MHGLHRRDDAELREPGDVGVIEDLNVLDSEPMIDRRDSFECGLIGVECDAVSAVANGMRRDLESVLKRSRRHVAQMLGLDQSSR